jgi:hypothetical protein
MRDREGRSVRGASEDGNERESAALQTNQFTAQVATSGLSRRGRPTAKATATRMHKDVMLAYLSRPNLRLTSARTSTQSLDQNVLLCYHPVDGKQ